MTGARAVSLAAARPASSRLAAVLLCMPLVLVLATLLLWPGARLLEQSLVDVDRGGLTAAHYAKLIFDPRLRLALLASFGLSGVVALVATVLCLAPAWLLVRGRFRGRRLLRSVLALPMSFSGVIVGFLMVITLGRSGFVPQLSRLALGEAWLSGAAYTFGGLCAAYLYFEIPRATLTLEAALRRVDFRLMDAARTLGAGRLYRLRSVLLPALGPALLSTWAVTFSVSLGSFGVVLILATRQLSVLPLEIFMAYLAFPSDRAAAAAMSVVLVALAFGVSYTSRRLLDRERPSRFVGERPSGRA